MAKRTRKTFKPTATQVVERKALALDAPNTPVPLMSDTQRLRLERRSVLDRITSNGTISACVMILAAVAAIICANTDAYEAIHEFLMRPVSIGIAGWEFTLNVELFVNDFLMAIFFLLVGTELKYEMTVGQLKRPRQAMLPMLAAVGGVIVPASIYAFVNREGAIYGWAIPMATDIAFALGVLSLLGDRVPPAIKVFFSTLAIADDLLAIVAIALFYGQTPDFFWLAASAGVTLLLVALNLRKHFRLAPYLALGLVLWFCLFQSGVHATLAGVILAFTIPARSDIDASGLVEWLHDKLPELDDSFDDEMHILGQHDFTHAVSGVERVMHRVTPAPAAPGARHLHAGELHHPAYLRLRERAGAPGGRGARNAAVRPGGHRHVLRHAAGQAHRHRGHDVHPGQDTPCRPTPRRALEARYRCRHSGRHRLHYVDSHLRSGIHRDSGRAARLQDRHSCRIHLRGGSGPALHAFRLRSQEGIRLDTRAIHIMRPPHTT